MLIMVICTLFACSGNNDTGSSEIMSVTQPQTEAGAVPATTSTVTSTTTTITTTTTTTTIPETQPPVLKGINTNDEIYSEYTFSREYNTFLAECVFVGDSICSGIDHYDILPDDNVIAEGNVSAFNIEGFDFTYHGYDIPLSEALADRNPRYIVFSMGMNDVNMGSTELYVQNYERLLSEVEAVLPEAVLIVTSITPIDALSEFCLNSKIDSYNAAIRDYLSGQPNRYFVDVSAYLKGEDNGLKQEYSSGDGIHLSRSAYHALLYQVCEQIVDTGIYQP